MGNETMVVETVPTPRTTVDVLGIGVDAVTMPQAIERIEAFIASRKPHMVVTADASGLYTAQSDAEFRSIVKGADLVTPDSIGVLWAAKRSGHALPERVSGVEIVERLCELSSKRGYRLFFLGGAPGVAEKASERIQLRYPGCNVVGAHDGYFDPACDADVAQLIAACKPDALLVAMGIPRQEKFIAHTQFVIKAPVAIGVGGTFDVLSGNVRRAPLAVQRLRLEWLWRTALNPRKLRKALSLPKFAWRVLRSSK